MGPGVGACCAFFRTGAGMRARGHCHGPGRVVAHAQRRVDTATWRSASYRAVLDLWRRKTLDCLQLAVRGADLSAFSAAGPDRTGGLHSGNGCGNYDGPAPVEPATSRGFFHRGAFDPCRQLLPDGFVDPALV